MSMAIEAIKKELEAKKAELKKLEEAIQRVQHIQMDVQALERTLRIFERPKETNRGPLQTIIQNFKKVKLHDLAYSVLQEAGKPLTGDELLPLMVARGCKSTKQSILGALYRCTKAEDRFVQVAPGTFGLIEWRQIAK